MTDTSPSSVADRKNRFRRSARDWDRIAVWAIVLGAALRIVWILVIHPPVKYIYSDMGGYVLRAVRLVSGAPLTPDDAFFPPGTHMLLSIPLGLFGLQVGIWAAAVLWCLLSIATVYMSWRLTRELLTPAAAALTTILCAGWPLFITYGGYFTSETPALALLVAALWAGVVATRREGRTAMTFALLSGVLGGAASAVRPQLLINIVIMAAIVFFASRRKIATVAWLAAGLLPVLALVVVYNSIASGQLSGLATNGGLNFWFGHCEARSVTILNSENQKTAEVGHPVPGQAGRPGDYVVRNHDLWDEQFFIGLGQECIEQDGLRHILRLGRNVLDMTATTMPWPQNESTGWSRDVVQAANVVYSVLLPWIVIESLSLRSRRRKDGERRGEVFMVLNLACVAVVAILVIGDPRVRTVYDVFGFALLGALLADRFHLDESSESSLGEVDGE
jgi:4-amino-4-deoxy-L-arabinose transferase-like glycosyltransferase